MFLNYVSSDYIQNLKRLTFGSLVTAGTLKFAIEAMLAGYGRDRFATMLGLSLIAREKLRYAIDLGKKKAKKLAKSLKIYEVCLAPLPHENEPLVRGVWSSIRLSTE